MTWTCPNCGRDYPDSGIGVPRGNDADEKDGCMICSISPIGEAGYFPLDIDPGKVDIDGKTVGTVETATITTDRIDAPELFDAFVAGFMQSGEGWNAEYPHAFNEEKIREAIREDFAEWCEDGPEGEM